MSVPTPSSKRVRQNDDGGLSFFFQTLSLYHSRDASHKIQYTQKPRQRAPARKGYKIWTEPEKDALTAGVKKYGPGATHNTTHIRGSFPPPPLSKGNTPNVVIHSRRRSTALLFGGVSFSLSLSRRRRRPLNRMFESNSKWNWNPLFPRDSKVLNKRLQKKEKKKTLEYNCIILTAGFITTTTTTTGQWKKILDDPAFGPKLKNRSNVDLKDKWRGASPTPKKKSPTPSAVRKPSSSAKKSLAFTKSPTVGARKSASKTRPNYTRTKPAPPPRRSSSARKPVPARKPTSPARKASSPAPAKKSAPAKASGGGCVIM